MRLAWLLALVAVPAVALAQTPPQPNDGQITVPTVARTSTDDYINIAECSGNATIRVRADVARTAQGNIAQFQLYAANTAGGVESVTKTGSCVTDPDPDVGFSVAGIGGARTTIISGEIIDADYATSLIAAAAAKSCASTGADEDIILCIKAMDTGGADLGWARGRLRFSTSEPTPPSLISVGPGEEALIIDWDAPDPGVLESYEAQASTDPAFSTTSQIFSSGRMTGTNVRLNGLQNNVEYNVRVLAFSDADNPSDPSNVVTGTPLPVNDLWEFYSGVGGVEQGGCSTGAAGAIALAGVAALLAFRRRS